MIAFNGQYLPAASHGNMRITDACLGGQWVMGGWLKTATQQAIIAAFGAEEGIAVIRRTNDYLNALALTDPTRAQQLAMFIQEDPLLVTSLVETSKTRWLVGDGKAYVDTNYSIKDENAVIHTKFRAVQTNRLQWIFGQRTENNNVAATNPIQVAITANNKSRIAFGPSGTGKEVPFVGIDIMEDCEVLLKKNYCEINGFKQNIEPFVAMPSAVRMYIFALLDGRTGSSPYSEYIFNGLIDKVKIDSVNPAHFIPCKHENQVGMLDIISGTFYPNANTQGSFTIAITDKQ